MPFTTTRRGASSRCSPPTAPESRTPRSSRSGRSERVDYWPAPWPTLEPYWLRAAGPRETLQGLIQVGVGFHHLSNGNGAGARALLHDGAEKLLAREIGGIAVDAFARAVVSTLDDVIRLGVDAAARFRWTSVPRFPCGPA